MERGGDLETNGTDASEGQKADGQTGNRAKCLIRVNEKKKKRKTRARRLLETGPRSILPAFPIQGPPAPRGPPFPCTFESVRFSRKGIRRNEEFAHASN